jgi:hypothetical protein
VHLKTSSFYHRSIHVCNYPNLLTSIFQNSWHYITSRSLSLPLSAQHLPCCITYIYSLLLIKLTAVNLIYAALCLVMSWNTSCNLSLSICTFFLKVRCRLENIW